MKKLILILVAIFGFVGSMFAEKVRYEVAVQVRIIYHYYDESGYHEVGTDSEPGTAQIIYVYAESPYEAEQEALSECSTMCQTNYLKDEGTKRYSRDGKYYICRSEKEVYNASAKLSPR